MLFFGWYYLTLVFAMYVIGGWTGGVSLRVDVSYLFDRSSKDFGELGDMMFAALK